MSASVSGSKTVVSNVAPHITGAQLTTLLSTAPENLKLSDLQTLIDAAHRVGGGSDSTKTLAQLFS
jgi:hypothetical protein